MVREGRSGWVSESMAFLSREAHTPTSVPEQRLVGGVDGAHLRLAVRLRRRVGAGGLSSVSSPLNCAPGSSSVAADR